MIALGACIAFYPAFRLRGPLRSCTPMSACILILQGTLAILFIAFVCRAHLRHWHLRFQRYLLQYKILRNMPRSDLVGSMKRFTAEEQRLVTFTITTHKRLHSFIPCFRSFLENCLDREQYIKEYLVVDDGSSPADRAAMRRAFPPERFPLVGFVFHNKGHPTSINTLLGHVTTPLWLAWEDDWELRTPTPLGGRAMAPECTRRSIRGGRQAALFTHSRDRPNGSGHRSMGWTTRGIQRRQRDAST